MKNSKRVVLGSLLGFAFAAGMAAQEMSAPPKVLQITREFVKPGKGGTAHDKSESAFVKTMSEAKWPTYYVALGSLSGRPRVLFLTSYASYEAWQKDGDAVEKNAALYSALDHAAEADGELLESMDQGVFLFQDEMSLRAHPDISDFRYIEVSAYHVRPGLTHEWDEAVKMVKAAYEKGVPGSHWGMFQETYGGDGGTYLVLTGHKSLSELDRGMMEGKQFQEAMGAAGMKLLEELVAKSVESSQHQLFAVDPRMSYVPDAWKKADPDFWMPKEMPESMKPAKEKKAKN